MHVTHTYSHIIIISIASKQLQTIVMKLVKESFGDTHYAKALECVKVLREEAINVNISI